MRESWPARAHARAAMLRLRHLSGARVAAAAALVVMLVGGEEAD